MSQKPKVLFLTSNWPLASAYGGQQRSLNIGKLLSKFCEVSFVIVEATPTDQETVRRTQSEFDVRRVVRTRPITRGNTFGRLRHRIRHEIDPSYLVTADRTVTESDRTAVLQLMRRYDAVWIHHIFTASVFNIPKWHNSVLDVDDLQSNFYSSIARTRDNPVRRLFDLRMSWIWRRRERLFTNRFDVVTVCSEQDRRYLGERPKIHVLPNGFNLPQSPTHKIISEPLRIGFIGAFNHQPNEEGAKWFIREVWPLVKREYPRVQLRLVGRKSDGHLMKLGADIAGLGWLEDPSDEIASWSAMIVPIRFGGGTRVKIAEAFARRCPVVTTAVGAFGYDVHDGKEVLLADRPEDFASACVRLLRNPQLGEALSETAHKRFLQEWTWDSFQNNVVAVMDECLARRHDSRPLLVEHDNFRNVWDQ
jgi:glycosyltransferase involved in cell wall biosynthesis